MVSEAALQVRVKALTFREQCFVVHFFEIDFNC